jgi:hypothetical protein
MFLPVLLLRDLGIWGFVVFAVPNVLGAAAMGWVMKSREDSRRFVAAHRDACVWFSLITIVFHAFFMSWIIRHLLGPRAGFAVMAAFLFFWIILQWRQHGRIVASVAALLMSAMFLGWGFYRGELPWVAHAVPPLALPSIDAVWLVPVCAFGFILCPYLDLTFHTARQELNPLESRAAFGIGFGVVFLLMILCTLSYSGWVAAGFNLASHPQIALILSFHIIIQSCQTAALHVRELSHEDHKIRVSHFLVFSAMLMIAVLLGAIDHPRFALQGMRFGEVVYRCFLVFYALVFPAYLWLCVIPIRRSALRLAVVVAMALPFYGMGFIEKQMIFLLAGVAIPVVAKFLPEARAQRVSA